VTHNSKMESWDDEKRMLDALRCNVNSPKIKWSCLQSLGKKGDDDGGECEAAHCEHQWNL